MIGLLCFALAVLALPFKSKLRLEAENAAGTTIALIQPGHRISNNACVGSAHFHTWQRRGRLSAAL
jgi:hypothetical protein